MADITWGVNRSMMMAVVKIEVIDNGTPNREMDIEKESGNINGVILNSDVNPDISNHHGIPREVWDKGHLAPSRSQTSP
ncbi:putative pectate lyase 12 protein [Sesbania bispinosa]|nr:putative pectate lyase 12 protein [Sesbania bispinosa]